MPPATNALDREITLRIPLEVVDWATGERRPVGAIAEVETRSSMLFATLFGGAGDYAKGLETILSLIAIVFAIVVVLALFVGTKLTRSITSAVDQLYEATKHVNRADFSHRITVQLQRPTGYAGELLQLDDYLDREAGRRSKRKSSAWKANWRLRRKCRRSSIPS